MYVCGRGRGGGVVCRTWEASLLLQISERQGTRIRERRSHARLCSGMASGGGSSSGACFGRSVRTSRHTPAAPRPTIRLPALPTHRLLPQRCRRRRLAAAAGACGRVGHGSSGWCHRRLWRRGAGRRLGGSSGPVSALCAHSRRGSARVASSSESSCWWRHPDLTEPDSTARLMR